VSVSLLSRGKKKKGMGDKAGTPGHGKKIRGTKARNKAIRVRLRSRGVLSRVSCGNGKEEGMKIGVGVREGVKGGGGRPSLNKDGGEFPKPKTKGYITVGGGFLGTVENAEKTRNR